MLNFFKIQEYKEMNEEFFIKYNSCLFNIIKYRYIDLYNKIINYSNEYNLNIKDGKEIKFSEKFYLYLNDMKDFPKCLICNNKYLRFISLFAGYNKTCIKCFGKDKGTLEKRKKSNIIKYGVDNPMKNSTIVNKMKESNIIKYNTTCTLHTKENEEKISSIILEKYGSKYPLGSKIIQEKIIKTNLIKYNCKYPIQNKIVKENLINSMKEKYGVNHNSQINDVKESKKTKNLEKYGVTSFLKTKEFYIKTKVTNILKYSNISSNSSNIVKEKLRKTQSFKYIKILQKKLLNEYTIQYNGKPNFTSIYEIKSNKCGHNFFINYQLLQIRIKNKEDICVKCNPIYKSTSRGEKELLSNIKQLFSNLEIQENIKFINKDKNGNKDEIFSQGRYELDIYIPKLNLGIEYNGLYWHSIDVGKDKNYHLDKLNFFKTKGIQLIQVFEDEWLFKKNIVLNRLFHIINGLIKQTNIGKNYENNINNNSGIINKKVIGAREVMIKEVDYNTNNEFLYKFHIQGKDNSKVRLGAYYKEELVGIMTFGKSSLSKGGSNILKNELVNNEVWELNRFATNYNYNIVGLASKFMKFFKMNYLQESLKNGKKITIFSYADKRWSNGDLYLKLGFNLIKHTDPNYYYFKRDDFIRKHRFNYRKDVLLKDYPIYKDKINEFTGKTYTEFEIMQEIGYYRIYDAGNLKFEKQL